MKQIFILCFFAMLGVESFSQNSIAVEKTFNNEEDTAIIRGIVRDKENNNEPLPFANVFIKGTQNGIDTDFDGYYALKVKQGKYILVVSFIGYDTLEIPFEIKLGERKIINPILREKKQGVMLKNVIIKTEALKEKEEALLSQQRGATIIKEAIGAKRLGELGISNASAATAKISGVDKSQNTGAIFIRGLSDRYLSTTMNRLPIPSDEIDNKNINLNLFSTHILQNVSLTKTYSVRNYGDIASGNIDITSKIYSYKNWKIGVSLGINENVMGTDLKRTVISNDSSLGFYKPQNTLENNITQQKWDPEKAVFPLNAGISLAKGFRLRLRNGSRITSFFSLGYSQSNSYRKGLFKAYRSHVLRNSFSDTEVFTNNQISNGFVNLEYKINQQNKIHYNVLFINKAEDNVFEQGRNNQGFVYDQDPKENQAFIRDQNLKVTQVKVQQIIGKHQINTQHKIAWAVGYNNVLAEEPNRIRNQGNRFDNFFQFAHVGDFQQRKSSQTIKDTEYNGYVEHTWDFLQTEEKNLKLNFGMNFRLKNRDFESLFLGVKAKGVRNSGGIDVLSSTFTPSNFDNNTLTLRKQKLDTYNAHLNIWAGYASLDWNMGKINANVGLRYEYNAIKVDWDVANYVGRKGKTTKRYNNFFPALNFKYDLTQRQLIRLAFSKTNTLPEFKELAPFEYVSPNGRVSKGYGGLDKSDTYNVDIKWAFFPSKRELLSVTSFYKMIQNPINLAQMRGSSGYFQYKNTGEKANVFGIELEAKWDLIKKQQKPVLEIGANVTKMWIQQDLLEEYQYNKHTATQLQGAAPTIINGSLHYHTTSQNPFHINVSANYTSDKILILGAPEDYKQSAILYNASIIEKGFITLDCVVSKNFSNHIQIKFMAKNLLNPAIKQTQDITDLNTRIKTTEIVSSYQNGRRFSLGINYTF